jgi:hypothetical protein
MLRLKLPQADANGNPGDKRFADYSDWSIPD